MSRRAHRRYVEARDPVSRASATGWVDPYTDEVLAQMWASGPLVVKADELRELGQDSFIGSTVDTTTNAVTVYWHGARPAAVDGVVLEGLLTGIKVIIVDAPYSKAQLGQTRACLLSRARELAISSIGHDPDGRGFTVHFRTAVAIEAAREGLAEYESHPDQWPIGDSAALPPAAVLHCRSGSPQIHISDELSDPQFSTG